MIFTDEAEYVRKPDVVEVKDETPLQNLPKSM
jgi:hypothetical protein